MAKYVVFYKGNSTRFKKFSQEIEASSEREASEYIYKELLDENYFPQGNQIVLDCDGNEIATAKDNYIEYDGGGFFAELIEENA